MSEYEDFRHELEGDYYDDCQDDEDFHPDDCDCDDCMLDECGRLPDELGGGCQLAGTEHCDFECPFRNGWPDYLIASNPPEDEE